MREPKLPVLGYENVIVIVGCRAMEVAMVMEFLLEVTEAVFRADWVML